MTRCSVAVVGGTGSTELLRGLCREDVRIRTALGPVDIALVHVGDTDFAFLHRHGPDHTVPPHAIRHERHMEALKCMGIRRILAINAVGSLRHDLHVGSIVRLTDFLSLHPTIAATSEGSVHHADLTIPYCPTIGQAVARVMGSRPDFVPGGVLVGVAGPRYETPAEVRLFGTLGGDVVGMTGASEAVAAREARLCYGALACVTNMGVGLTDRLVEHGEVSAAMKTILRSIRDDLLSTVYALSALTPPIRCCGVDQA